MQPTTQSISILYVGSEDTHTAFSEQLQLHRRLVELTTVSSLDDARQLLTEQNTSCVLVDATGERTATLRLLDGIANHTEAPVIAFTGEHDASVVEELLGLGVTDVIQSTVEETPSAVIRRRLESALETDEDLSLEAFDQYETILDSTPDAIYQLDTDGRIVQANDAGVELLETDRSELIGSHAREYVGEKEYQLGIEKLRAQLIEKGQTHSVVDVTVETPDGTSIPCETRVLALRSDGELDGTVVLMRDVREKREQEQRLHERDELLRHLNENLGVVFWVDGLDGQLEYASSAFDEFWGRPRDELYENDAAFLETVHPEDRERIREAHEKKIADPDSYDEEYRIVRPDGEVRWIHSQGFGVYENGELKRTVGISQDITERKEREQEIQELTEQLELAVEGANLGIWDWELPSGRLEFNAQLPEMLGYSKETFESHIDAWRKRVHPDDLDEVKATMDSHRDGESNYYDIEYRMKTADDGWKWIRDVGRIVERDEDGTPVRAVGIHLDVDERKSYERALENERDMFAQGPIVVFKWENAEGWPVEYVSENVTEMFGYTPEEFESGTVSYANIVHREDRERVYQEVAENSGEGDERFSHEPYRIVTADGDVRWVLDHTKNVWEDGEITHRLGYLIDITEQREKEIYLEKAQEIGDIGWWRTEIPEQRVYLSEWMSDIWGTEDNSNEMDYETYMEFVHPEDRAKLDEEWDDAIAGEPYDVEFRIVTGDDEVKWMRETAEFTFGDDGEAVSAVGVVQDITEQKEREEELLELDRLNHIIRNVDEALVGATTRREIESAVCDNLFESGRYQYVIALQSVGNHQIRVGETCSLADPIVEELFATTDRVYDACPVRRALETGNIHSIGDVRVPGTPIAEDFREAANDIGIASMAAIPVTYEGRAYGVLVVLSEERNAFEPRELDVLDELGGTVGHAIAAVESREREATVTALYEATQDLLAAETQWVVSRVVVDTAADVLEPSGIGIFLFDDEKNVLRPASTTDALLEFYDESAVFGPGGDDSLVWETYVSGEKLMLTDVSDSAHRLGNETSARRTLMIPLGDHGVFVVAGHKHGPFEAEMERLIGLLATTTEAALDRVAGKVGIRERDQQLERRSERLGQFQQMFSLIGDTDRLLRQAGTREEIERGVCERLVDVDSYAFAWIGRIPPDETTLVPQVWAGRNDGYLDAVTLEQAEPDGQSGLEPAIQTATTGESTTIQNVTDYLRDQPWAREALDRGYQSALAVPLVYGDATYGVLTVYAEEPGAFDDIVCPVLTTLGKTIADSINSVETRRGILADRAVELELELADPGTFLNAVAEVAEKPVSYREITPESGGRAQVLFALADTPVEDVLALEDAFVAVESLTHVNGGSERLYRATLASQTVSGVLLECGAIPREVTATAETTRATVRIPRELDVREFLARVRESFPETKLVSRHDVGREADTRETVQNTFTEGLTDRQREVLLTAYESGYFESPRETTGVELADLLSVSQPTVTHHLREAQRRLFTAMFEEQ